ncbi:InlB B-repeat-containing protein [Eubacterium sp. 1001713B170207_170306_E7]|uniref:InlB B-repeat-containing protein n=1 Tax=Eubacterium sp. 1001713B170207_170306_E7 TaxID=2787097 RepID=UPI0018984103|nr:InlB B-repeat-containing protein [Eubacterium sp. 1001713B170207_170306_E7]
MTLCLCLVLMAGVMPWAGGTVQAAEEDWDTYTARIWDNTVAEFESYGLKGWTVTDDTVPKWSGEKSNLSAGDENGRPENNPMVMPEIVDSVYEIYYPEQLRYAMEAVSAKGGTINIKNDMDLGGTDTDGTNSIEAKKWTAIILSYGTVINGEGHTIYNLNAINAAGYNDYAGFIGASGRITKISGLHFVSAKINGGNSSALFGRFSTNASYYGSISNCSLEHALMEVGGTSGGLVAGTAQSSGFVNIDKAYTKNVYIKGTGCIGNLSGPSSGTITNSYAVDGIVIGAGDAGGFKSCSSKSTLKNCFSNIAMYGKTAVGAFTGDDYGSNSFTNCYTSGIVEGQTNVGGFTGLSSATKDLKSNYQNCYSTAITGMEHSTGCLGGFIGAANSYVNFNPCYAVGEVGKLTGATTYTGGFSGNNAGNVANCYYDKQMSGMREVAGKTGVAGKTTKELTGKNVTYFSTNKNWVCKDSLYPQLKVFADPETVKQNFGDEQADLVMAYSEASVSTAFLRDNTAADATDYDTVRDIADIFELTNNKNAPDNNAVYEWQHDSVRHPDNIKSLVSPGEDILTINRDENNDRVTNMAPGIGWVQASATVGGVTGNRALRFCPTVSLSLSTANPDMGIGCDVRLYPALTEVDSERSYDHKKGVNFIKATAADLAAYNPDDPATALPSVTYPGDNYKKVPVSIGGKVIGEVSVTIQKMSLDGKTTVKDILDTGDPDSGRNVQDYEDLFNGSTPFTDKDYGTYTITYNWLIDKKPMTASKKLYVLPGVTLNYCYNDSDDTTGSAGNPVDDLFAQDTVRIDAKVVDALTENPTVPGMEFLLPAAAPTRAGYTFAGWSLKADSTPEDYTAGTSAFKKDCQITEDMGSSVNIYAVWQPRKYDLQFNYPVGSFEDKAPQTLRDVSYDKSVKTDNKAFPQELKVNDVDTGANRIFLGWSTIDPANPPVDPESGKAVEAAVNFDENTVINKTQDAFKYSSYFENEGDVNTVIPVYPVLNTAFGTATFYQNDGSQEEDGSAKIYETQQKKYNDVVVRPAIAPSRPGYIFRGWSDEALAPIEKNERFEEVLKSGESSIWLGENQSYYAVWERVPYTVEFYKNDGATGVQPYRSLSNKTYGDKLSAAELAGPSRTGYGFAGWSVNKDASVADFTADTAIAGNTTLYAVWKINEYTVTFYVGEETTAAIFGAPVTGVKYNASIALPQNSPTRAGYSFAGWKYKENGLEKDFTDQVSIMRDTRVYAAWTKAVYDLDVFLTPDSKNPQTPDKTLAGIPYGETLGNRLPAAPSYWTDKSGQKYQFTGYVDSKGNSVTGETVYQKGDLPEDRGTLTATYTQKVYDITAEKSGYGSIVDGTGTFKAGDNTAVSWAPDKGYQVGRVLVDGRVRDDLRNGGKAGSVTFDAINQNHHVSIVFEKETEAPEPQKWYTIYTTKNGGGDDSTLTQTATVEAGKNYEVKWQAGEGYRVTGITMDGIEQSVSDSGSISFAQVSGDHEVVVNFKPVAPELDTGKTPGFWTITTRQTGGDPAQTTLTPTMVVVKNSSPVIQWGVAENSGYQIKRIILDKDTADERVLTPEEMAENSYTFEKISGDHTVDVIFANDNGEVIDPEKKLYKVETILTGGPGSITGSAVVPEGGSYEVEWAGPEDERYIVEDIKVNGEPQETTKTQEVFENIQEDSRIEVKLKPNLRHIETDKVGSGSISPSKTVFYKEDYTVEAKPQEGWYLRRVEFDGEVKEFDDPTAAQAKAFDFFKEHVVQADDLIQINGDEITVPLQSIVEDHQIRVTFVKNGEEEIPVDALCGVRTSIVGGPGTIEGGGTFLKGESTLITWRDIEEPFMIDSIAVTVDGVLDRDLSQAAQNGRLALPNLQNDYEVVITLKHGDDSESEVPPDQPKNTHDVVTRISGAPGASITASQLGVNEGNDVLIEWQYDNNLYEIKDVKIDGQSHPELATANGYTFEGLSGSHLIEVVLDERGTEMPEPEPGQFTIATSVAGGVGGVIDPSVIVNEGDSRSIAWKAQEGYRVAAVIVDGIIRDDLRGLGNEGKASFEDIHENHSVTVIFKEENTTVKPEHFVIETSIEGCGTITPTKTLDAGADHEVRFTPDSGYRATRVEVDGVVCNHYLETGSIFFKSLSENHRVNVIFEKESGTVLPPDDNDSSDESTSDIPDTVPGNDYGSAGGITPGYPEVKNSGHPVVTVGSVAPYTGIVSDNVRRSSAAAGGSTKGYTPLLQRLLNKIYGEGKDGLSGDATSMALIDLLSAALCLAMTVCAFFFKKHSRWMTLLISVAAVLLFFGTQPLVLMFTLADRWSPVFLLMLCASAVAMLMMGEEKEEERGEEIE